MALKPIYIYHIMQSVWSSEPPKFFFVISDSSAIQYYEDLATRICLQSHVGLAIFTVQLKI